MARSNYIDYLNPTELLVLLRHLELGEDHLRHILSREEFDQLMRLERLDTPTEVKLGADKPEVAGNVFLVMNSVFTATLGLWMGLSGFLGVSLHSFSKLALVLSFAVIAGAIVGYLNFHFTKNQAKRALNKRKIQAFQLDILNQLEGERKEEIDVKTEELNQFLKELRIQKSEEQFTGAFESEKQALEWVKRLDVLIENNRTFYKEESVYQLFSKEIDSTKDELKDSLKIYDERKEIERDSKEGQKREGYYPFIKKLTLQTLEEKIPRASWFRSNLTNIFISAIPTLFGGFSSTFVYFSGVPTIAQEFGKNEIATFLTNPEIKKIEIISALFITVYFAFNFLYLNYKSFVRNREFEETEEALIRKKNYVRKLDNHLLKIKEARSHMLKLRTIFKNLKALTHKKNLP